MGRDPRKEESGWERSFWPRQGGRDISAEVDYDRPCPHCGYNMRGLPMRARCPECGAIGGWSADDGEIAWDDEAGLGAYVSTCVMAISRPHAMARQVWRRTRFDMARARRFRRIAITVAAFSLSVVAFQITMQAGGLFVACASLPLQACAIIAWLNSITLEPLSRLKDWSTNDAIAGRVQTVVHYLSATLVLTPLHLPLLLLTTDLRFVGTQQGAWLIAAGLHVVLLMFQLAIAGRAVGWLLFELIDMPAIQAQMMALGGVITGTASACVALIGVQAMIGLMMYRIFG